MKDLFLAVNKKYFSLGLNLDEVIIMAQVEEFQRNKCECFMTNEQFASLCCESRKTVERALNNLEKMNIISRKTTLVSGSGQKTKQRTISLNKETEWKVQCDPESSRQSDASSPESKRQNVPKQASICPEGSVNLSQSKRQNDAIKDNRKDNIKDKEKDNKLSVYFKDIGIEWADNSLKVLEDEIGTNIDESILIELIRSNGETWKKISSKSQSYKFGALKNIVKRDYEKTRNKIEAYRLQAKLEAEQRKNEPVIDYKAMGKRAEKRVNNQIDITDILNDIWED